MKHQPIVFGPASAVFASCLCGWTSTTGHHGPRARDYAYTEAVMHCEWADEFEVIVDRA